MEKQFVTLTNSVYSSGRIQVEQNCYGFALINKGGTAVRINQILLKPYPPLQPELSGESFSFVDPQGRTLNQTFEVNFQGGGTDPFLQIVQFIKSND